MKRCTRCMTEIEDSCQICPNCGFVQVEKTQPSNALKRNTILKGRYLIGNVIGQGGFGITYIGFDLTLEMKVAVKEYFPSGSAMRNETSSSQVQWNLTSGTRQEWSDGLERFLKEAKKMAKLDSVPAIVRVRDAFQDNQTAYIVMDFVEGDTLKDYLLRYGIMRYQDCIRLLTPVMNSLAVMHDAGFIHRDISPDNIMIQPDGSARLLDMGAVVDIKANGGYASMAVIKRNFSAPEQYLESAVAGSWTDVYGMAASIYYCLTGKTVPEAMERELKKIPISFDPQLQLPPQAICALNDALELNAEKRTRSIREFQWKLSAQQGQPAFAGTWNHTVSSVSDYESKTEKPSGKSRKKAAAVVTNLETKPVRTSVAVLFAAAVVLLAALLVSAVNEKIGVDVMSMSGIRVGFGIGLAVFLYYKKQGDSKRGAHGFYACAAISSIMGWLPALAFAGFYEMLPRFQRRKDFGEAISWKQKLLFVVCIFVFGIMLLLDIIGIIVLLN